MKIEYAVRKACLKDVPVLVHYKLANILEYAKDVTLEDKKKIEGYVQTDIQKELENAQMILVKGQIVGCLIVTKQDDGMVIDEIYLDDDYRNQGIGTDSLKQLLKKYSTLYLWVYKLNYRAFSLYQKLGFRIVEETESRYYMRYER